MRATRRRRVTPLMAIVSASLVASGGAYAARGLWLPELGNESYGHAVATAGAAPADQRATFGVLRRPQTDEDRGPAVQAVLRRLDPDYGQVRTDAVRKLAELPDGTVAVLVSARLPRGFDPTLPNLPQDQLLLGFYDPVTRDVVPPSLPSDALGVRAGNMMINVRKRMTNAQRARDLAFQEAEHVAGRLTKMPGTPPRYGVMSVAQGRRWMAAVGINDSDPSHWVGLVPDGVATVRVDDRAPVAVHDNFFIAPSTVGTPDRITWLDAHGQPVPFASTAGAWK